VARWLDILEATQQILLVPPYFENLGKRLVKSPKLYIADPGLACHLLGIESDAELARGPFLGAVFEGWVAAEVVKAQANLGRRRELYYFRDQQGLEVDFVAPGRNGAIHLIEAKATRSPVPSMASSLLKLAAAMRKGHQRGAVSSYLVHRGTTATTSHAVAPGVSAVTLPELVALLGAGQRSAS
jgi:predicted AAA+ superfamily ATPase